MKCFPVQAITTANFDHESTFDHVSTFNCKKQFVINLVFKGSGGSPPHFSAPDVSRIRTLQ